MPTSPLSFGSSSAFRDILLAKNLAPYHVTGVYNPPSGPISYEPEIHTSNVIDSPDTLIADDPFASNLYPLNEYGPNGGFNTTITFNGPPLPVASNQGEYDPTDTVLDLVNEFYIDAAYIENVYGPSGGYNDMVIITDVQNNNKIYQPYWNPPTFVPSSYTPYSILFSTNPTGSDGTLSQDSYIAKIGAERLNYLFQERINAEIFQNTVGTVNLQSLSDPFEASLIASGMEPLVYRNYRITVPESPIVAALDLVTRLGSAYWPVSLIPGSYYNENKPGFLSQQTTNALSVVNQLTGGLLGPILNKTRNPSEIFLANTGNGQRSVLFNNINYNRYQPDYKNQYGGLLGAAQSLVNLAVNLINPDNGTLIGGYYVGSRNAEPSTITSPSNQIPVNVYGQQVETPVYGPSELGILYEGNDGQLNFGLAGKSLSDGGGIDGQFVWTSPKYKDNAGFKATPGGGTGSLDSEFNQISSNYSRDESTNLTFKGSSILDQTQQLINSADNVAGINRLKHVGNAINQVSKVFNDGYKEMTKGSQVLSYKDFATGQEKGIEYCRVFTKDTPYYTYADLQKTDGITTSGRRFSYSVFDNTYNLNIAPLKNPGSTNIIADNAEGKGGYAKKYMFSIENLAWRTSSRPGFTYDELPVCEKGPNGGRVMWFPPYDLKFSDTSSANWNSQSFLGRPEPIYTYKDTSRTGQLSWKIIVDHPSVMNVIVNKQLKGQSKEKVNSIIDSFFAGCVKYDIYQLGLKFNTIPTKDLYTYQEILNNPRATKEEIEGVKQSIPAANAGGTVSSETGTPASSTNDKATPDSSGQDFENEFNELAFYFHNDIPDPNTNRVTSSVPYTTTYDSYTAPSFIQNYVDKSNAVFKSDLPYCKSNVAYCDNNKKVKEFFDNIIIDNFTAIDNPDNGFIRKAFNLLKEKNATINLELIGSASAPASPPYNVNLSKRRNDSVMQYLKARSKEIGCDLTPYIDNKKFILADTGYGEEITVTPKSAKGGAGSSVNCTTDIKNGSGVVTSNSQIYSVDAMSCRRVKIKTTVKVEPVASKNDVPVTTTDTSTPPKTIDSTVQPVKPVPTVSIEKKLKEGIGKRILRQLLSECDYFEVIKEEVPMLYDSIKEKIKYFNPAFHSMTPEGLNARLTFLNQCVRPGETIPTIGPDGKPKYNDAVNTSFGAPPVLVLRIGDFYNTKIIPKSVSFTYEPLVYDMNPEGIGIQPMIANVSMNFDFIGGMGLAKPVEQLQNALSFNYYANTEIYDERAVWTEDTSALDKELLQSILETQGLSTVDNVDNKPQNQFGDTIGQIINFNRVTSGETGEISYQTIMDRILKEAVGYSTNVVNQLESVVLKSNYGVLQMINQNRNYRLGHVYTQGVPFTATIYGKSVIEGGNGNNKTSVFKQLFDKAISDVNSDDNPIIHDLFVKMTDLKDNEKRVIKQNMVNYLNGLSATFGNDIQSIITEMCNQEQDLVLDIRKLEVINGGPTVCVPIDGKKLQNGTPLVYNLSGSTKVSESTKQKNLSINDTFIELQSDIESFYLYLQKLNDLLAQEKIITNTYSGVGDFRPAGSNLTDTIPNKTFFMLVARIFNDKNTLETFKKSIMSSNISSNNKLVRKFGNIVDDYAKEYSKELNDEEKIFTKFKKSNEYKKFTEGTDELMYPAGKTRILLYTTVPDEATKAASEEKLKKLFSNVNNDSDKEYFDNVVKFN